ncbi:DUF2130 domain-containing protein [Adlercreutzia sp. ZJ473]|uniref:DUF2130 domain-containing protein n=1 Tax=Adlercreutzia sp. ZJ473 TaxID=2722822 RepID=UPI001554C8CE|nr:DUF2130 domain-containing protein [Adlercreutzia sp. ZJ473]
MSEIKCPHCGKTFVVDESGYAELLRQVRSEEFAREIAAQRKQVEAAAKAREEAAAARAEAKLAEAATRAEAALSEAAVRAQAKLAEAVTAKDAEIAKLSSQLDSQREAARAQVELAAREAADAQAHALQEAERERDALKAQLATQAERAEAATKLALQQAEHEIDALKAELSSQAERAEAERELALQKERARAAEEARAAERKRDEQARDAERAWDEQSRAAERAIAELRSQLDLSKLDQERIAAQHQTELATREALMQEQIDARDREIDNIKHMRAELSVKMIGESLEQFCENEFNKLRATAFRTAYFQKDNDAKGGSKGDYIYRECDEDGNEIVSIMFEMKNEADDSTHKKRNEDHFAKLHRDRTAKGCEYAVLVSLLERDSDLYNTGIVDVSYSSGFEKMYVIRPQFFIPLITLIRNAAMRSLDYRRELAEVRQQNVDVTYFEDQLEDFKGKFDRNCTLARNKFQAAVKDIDATIKKLEKIRDELTSSDNNLRLANDKLSGITVKRLTRKNPTMKEKFAEARAAKEAGEVPPYAPEKEWEEVVEAELIEVEDAEE